jgi:ParB family chromosome partitioning protein
MSSQRLGRGLASLIPDSALDTDAATVTTARSRMVPLDEVRPNPEQPREVFNALELRALADSIAKHGVLAPLLVRKEEGHYVLIAGERRLRAAGLAGLSEVPVIVRAAPDAGEQLELALVENLQRADLDPVEAAKGYQRLVQEYGYTQEEVAKAAGRDRSTVANTLRLLKLPDFVLRALREGRISAGHARALLPLSGEDELRRALAKVIAQQMNVRATERMVASLTRLDPVVRTTDRLRRERTMEYATSLLERALHTSVRIRPLKRGGGRILIDYADAEDLERLISHLRAER